MTRSLFTNARIATMANEDGIGLVEHAGLMIEGESIAWLGPASEAPASEHSFDCKGSLITPGLIDCHTHLVHAGSRAREFEMRLEGATYAEIAQAGGGIVSTVKSTRAATEDDLIATGMARLECLLAEGVTTVEIKSGYGLDVETEARMLRAARAIGKDKPVDVVTSFLGAHALPTEYRDDRAAYVSLVCDKAMPAVANAGLADAVDGFCETIGFTIDEVERVFVRAAELSLPIKLHAEQLSNMGGVQMAARHGALSVDHLEYLDEDGVAALVESGTVAVLLPGAFYYLRETSTPPVEAMRRHGVAMAVATDLNPGSSPLHSLLGAMNMACVLFGLTPEEALRGVTTHAARALGLSDRGRLQPGLRADFVLWNAEGPADLVYSLGLNHCAAVVRHGELVRQAKTSPFAHSKR